ncbi:uncharacterized protein LOC130766032 [Actinidia eriantha]|uniref:uncharacterized protein LOC130766032 n=1 Tax=Actinidia eriantha TaxID=165200 RepID=UPI00258449FD|nr:uncharacterized protein LOC130766032 [Actinidia eriantha]
MAGGFPTYLEYLQYLEQAQEMGEDQVAILVDDDEEEEEEDSDYEVDYNDGDEEDYNDGEEDGPVPPTPRTSSGSRSTPSQEALIARSSYNVAEENEVSRKTTEGGETSSQGGGESTGSEIDGLFCPICMDAWTNGGDHQVCCLPCGHLYGASCIKRWLRQRKNSGKCPQCNRKCSMKDVRVIYARQIVAVDHQLRKKVPALEAKCASFEKKDNEWQMKEKNGRGKKHICIRKCTNLQRHV